MGCLRPPFLCAPVGIEKDFRRRRQTPGFVHDLGRKAARHDDNNTGIGGFQRFWRLDFATMPFGHKRLQVLVDQKRQSPRIEISVHD